MTLLDEPGPYVFYCLQAAPLPPAPIFRRDLLSGAQLMKGSLVEQVFSADCGIEQTQIVYKETRARMDPDPLVKVPLPSRQGTLIPQLLVL
jgi:hypothetical protein